MIDFEKIVEIIHGQIMNIIYDDARYEDTKVYIATEQMYINDKSKDENAIYLIVKFLPATLTFGQTVLPFTITAMGNQNKVADVQNILLAYAETFNMTELNGGKINQFYTAPNITSNFEEVYSGFCSLAVISGTMLISENINNFKVYLIETVEGETTKKLIETITQNFSTDIQIDTQAFSGEKFTQSRGKVATITLGFTTYLTNDEFTEKCLNIAIGNASVNNDFTFSIEFDSGISYQNIPFKLVNASGSKDVGNMPIISFTFTR